MGADDKFPARLQWLRENQKPIKSRRVTSELCGLPPNAFQRYERGERKPGYDALVAIADYFGVSLDWLTGRK